MKKAQISMNMIVFLAIALLILVLVVTFATGGITRLFGGLVSTGTGDLDRIKADCLASCTDAQSKVSTLGTDAWTATGYCTATIPFDDDGDGTIDADDYFSCWQSPIDVPCSTTVQTPAGAAITCQVDEATDTCVCV